MSRAFPNSLGRGRFFETRIPGGGHSAHVICQRQERAQCAGNNPAIRGTRGTGTAANPFFGFESTLMRGNTLIVIGRDITAPLVTGNAGTPAYGGWTVSSYDST